ncbi:hypothetical protein SBADM41S_10832 [Streptomyces badius]
MHLWSYVGGVNQQWRPQALACAGQYRFVARHSGRSPTRREAARDTRLPHNLARPHFVFRVIDALTSQLVERIGADPYGAGPTSSAPTTWPSSAGTSR